MSLSQGDACERTRSEAVMDPGEAMGELVGLPVTTDSENFLVVEVDEEEPSGGLVLAAVPDPAKGIAKAQVTLEQALTSLKPSLHKIAQVLRELAPEEAEIEFGLKIGGETGVIVAKGTAEVNFIIRMTWKARELAPEPVAERAEAAAAVARAGDADCPAVGDRSSDLGI